MKKMTRFFFTTVVLLFLSLQSVITLADPPDPPPPPGGHGQGGNAAAPIDGGLAILMAMGLGYGTRKVYILRRKEKGTGGE